MHTRFHRSVKRPVKMPAIFRQSAAQELQLKIIPHAHLKAIIDGRGGVDEFLTLCFRIMVGGSLTSLADEEGEVTLEKEFDPGIEALLAIGTRYEKLGKIGVNGDELLAIKHALNLTDDLQEASTRKQQSEMYQQVSHFVGGFEYTMKNLRKLKEIRS